MLPLDDMTGEGAPAEGPLDAFVDLPPFGGEAGAAAPPHLRLSIRGYPATSAGIVVRARIF
jgi:hypothetical protein